jgi:hypothetical protein
MTVTWLGGLPKRPADVKRVEAKTVSRGRFWNNRCFGEWPKPAEPMRRCTRPWGPNAEREAQMRKRVAMTAAIAVLVGLFHAVPVAQ